MKCSNWRETGAGGPPAHATHAGAAFIRNPEAAKFFSL